MSNIVKAHIEEVPEGDDGRPKFTLTQTPIHVVLEAVGAKLRDQEGVHLALSTWQVDGQPGLEFLARVVQDVHRLGKILGVEYPK
jgi:hypothetical protein